jgi:hypothetical protein
MNGTIFIFENHKKKKMQNQFVGLGVDSVALRHTLVYVRATLQY